MSLKKKRLARFGISGFIILIFLICAVNLPDSVIGKSAWKWSRKYPKPYWWTWGKKFESVKPVRGGYFRTAAPKYIGLMNPNHWPVNDWVTMINFYEGSLCGGGKFKPSIPWLVESWKYLNTKTVVMTIRKGIKFHDGSDLNAEGYKYHMEWIMDKKNGAWTKAFLNQVKSIKVVDKYTLKWYFKSSWSGFPALIHFVPGWMISAKALKGDVALKEIDKLKRKIKSGKKKLAKYERKGKAKKAEKTGKQIAALEEQLEKVMTDAKGALPLDQNPVGTGPYMLEEASPGNYLKLKRNPNWWFGKTIGKPEMPYFDGVKVTVVPEPSVRLANLKAGKIDSLNIDPSLYKLVKKNPRLKPYVIPDHHLMSMKFNHAKGPCRDIRVRKAISHAIDRKAVINAAMFGFATEASCIYPSIHWAHNPRLKPVKYDPELSRKLLAGAGFSGGLKIKGFMSNLPISTTTGEVIKGMLAKVGIDWKFEQLDSGAQADRRKNLEYDFAQMGWVFVWDPDMIATSTYHPDGLFNSGRSTNKKVIALIEAGRKQVNMEKRKKIYFKLEEALYNNYEDAWLWWPKTITVLRKNVYGFNLKMYIDGRQGFWNSHPRWFKDGKP